MTGKVGDYGPMARAQLRAENGQIQPDDSEDLTDEPAKMSVSEEGSVLDLLIAPVKV